MKNLWLKNYFFLIIFLLAGFSFVYPQKDNDDAAAVFLSQLIQKPSVTGNEGVAGRFLKDFCEKKGLNVRIFSDTDSTYNFCASLYPLGDKKPNIVFLSHIDVVPAGDIYNWTHPPFAGVIDGGYVWGRGAIDCKGLLVMQLFAILNYLEDAKNSELPYNLSILMVSGEEGGNNNGSDYISNNHLAELNAVVIFGEGGSGLRDFLPSDPELAVFGISVSEKKALWLMLTAETPSSGHSALAPEVYANKRLLRALIRLMNEKKIVTFDKSSRRMFRELGKIEGGVRGFFISHIHWGILTPFVKSYYSEGGELYSFVNNTFVITRISNPASGYNQISDKACAVLDYRLLPEIETSKYIRKIENVVGPRIDIQILLETPGARHSDPDSKYFDAMAAALKETYPGQSRTIPILFPATTDNNYYRSKGIPVYGIMPCIFSRELLDTVHNYDERIAVNEIYTGIRTFITCIDILQKDLKYDDTPAID